MQEKIIERAKKITKNPYADSGDCRLLLEDCAQLIETKKKQEEYSSIILYRNWLSHSALTRNPIPAMLNRIHNQLLSSNTEPNFCDFIAELLSTKKLRNELKNIFQSINCTFPILDSLTLWKKFFGCICNELLNKPLVRPLLSPNPTPQSLWLGTSNDKVIFVVEVAQHNNVASSKTVEIWGFFPLDENKKDFLYP